MKTLLYMNIKNIWRLHGAISDYIGKYSGSIPEKRFYETINHFKEGKKEHENNFRYSARYQN